MEQSTAPETTVAWEGDRASGTVALEPAGWGTKVILTATLGFFARLIRRRVPQPALAVPAPPEPRLSLSPPAPGPEPTPPEPDPAPTLLTPDAVRTEAIHAEVLDDLGAAHHRPFSRG